MNVSTIGIILLAIIAYFLWKIYRQREDEKRDAAIEKSQNEQKQEKEELESKYPHLAGNLEGNWLQVFALQVKKNTPLLKVAWIMYAQTTSKMEPLASIALDNLWNLSEELLEHLEEYHEGLKGEYEIAIVTYWQIAATEAETILEKNPTADGKPFQSPPFTDLQKIASWFPKKQGHPEEEISFVDEKTKMFPRKSGGSSIIQKKLHDLGL